MSNNFRLQHAAIKLSKYRLPVALWFVCLSIKPAMMAAMMFSPQWHLRGAYGMTDALCHCVEAIAIALFSVMTLLLVYPPTFRMAWKVMLIAIVVSYSPYLGDVWSDSVRVQAFSEVGEKATGLIQAIEAYEYDHNSPPASLSQLIPTYIAAIPETGIAECPKFKYSKAGSRTRDAWELCVDRSQSGGYDIFIYAPYGNYLAYYDAGSQEKVGNWLYVHD